MPWRLPGGMGAIGVTSYTMKFSFISVFALWIPLYDIYLSDATQPLTCGTLVIIVHRGTLVLFLPTYEEQEKSVCLTSIVERN